MIKCKPWFSRILGKNSLPSLLPATRIPFAIAAPALPPPSPPSSHHHPCILSLSSRSRIIQAFRYIRAWLADFDIKCERANTRSTIPLDIPNSIGLPSFFLLISFHPGRTLGCFTLLGSFIRAPLSFRVLIGNNSKMIPDAMLYARKYSGRNLISTVVLLCKV